MTEEEELFGNIYESGARTVDAGYYIDLEPADDATWNRLVAFNITAWADTGAGNSGHPAWMFGWTEPKAGGKCGSLADYSDPDKRPPETHWSGPDTPPSGIEKHCIRPGSYRLTVRHGGQTLKSYFIDYIPLVPSGPNAAKDIWNSTFGVYEHVEAVDYDDTSNVWLDLVPHADVTGGSYSDNSVLDGENAGSNPASATFTNASSLSGSELDWFRFSVARSTSAWNLSPKGTALSRLHWDLNVAPDIRSGFYDALTDGHGPSDPTNNQYVIRVHQFEAHVLESRTVTVGLETMRPDEQPDSSTGIGVTRSVDITRLTPQSCSSFEAFSTWRETDQYLTVDCSSRGPDIRYRWQFEDGGAWTPYTSDTLHDFAGHASQGSHEVTLEVKNTATGYSSFETKPIDVESDAVVLSGATYIPDKRQYTYEARVNGASLHYGVWFERYNPDPPWFPATGGEQHTMTRIWPAGDYSVELRQEKAVGGTLRRGRLHIDVCSVKGCMPPAVAGQEPLALADPVRAGTVFGAGPWVTWGADAGGTLRLYDLWGQHDLESPFGTAAWGDAPGGEVVAPQTGIRVAWTAQPGPAGARIRQFAVSGVPRDQPYLFGFAIDFDVGDGAGDDRAGFDRDLGLVWVADGTAAAGAMIRRGAADALASVREFGAGRFAPGTREASARTHRRGGIDITGKVRDVQLLLSAPEATGAQKYQVILLEAESVVELRALADKVLGSR